MYTLERSLLEYGLCLLRHFRRKFESGTQCSEYPSETDRFNAGNGILLDMCVYSFWGTGEHFRKHQNFSAYSPSNLQDPDIMFDKTGIPSLTHMVRLGAVVRFNQHGF